MFHSHCFMMRIKNVWELLFRSDLHFKSSNFLLVGGGGQEAVHLAFQRVVHLHVDIITGRFLLIGGVHTIQRKHTGGELLLIRV